MAHSIQLIGEKAEAFNDLDLLVLVGLMISELEHNAGEYSALRPYIDIWSESRFAYAPGVIDLRLNDAVSRAGGRDQLEQLLSAVERRLESFGEIVPASKLNSQWPVPGVTFHDYSTSLVENAINKLKRLIKYSISPPTGQ